MEEKRIFYAGIDHGNQLMKSANHVFENGVERLAAKPTFSANTLISFLKQMMDMKCFPVITEPMQLGLPDL